MSRIRRILHATDFSSASRAAFARAVEMAKTNRAELLLVHVMSPIVMPVGEGYISADVYNTIEASTRAASLQQLKTLLARARKAGARARTLLLDGIAHERIVRAARTNRADVIVIGTHGRTGLAKLFLGSVAGRVLAIAHCPVLTVRGK
jgi:nucleotide-binding universal stress UspA family protein